MPATDLTAALAAPFPADVVGWKAQTVKGERALAVAYIDARDVMDRLDAVVLPEGWQDAYTLLPDGNVVCRLSLWIGGEWVAKEDVGGPSEQPDEGDRMKAAFSDALKRAAVKWGVGRYLYRLPAQWCDYDPQRKQLRGTPRLPDWALPAAANGRAAAAPAAPKQGPKPPETAAEFQAWVCDRDAYLAKKGVCKGGELVAAVVTAGEPKGYPGDLAAWPKEGWALAGKAVRDFEAARARPAGSAP